MNQRLFEILSQTDGMSMPLYPDQGDQENLRRKDKAAPAAFPAELTVEPRRK